MEPRHILIVEDSPTQARFTAMLLERAGHRVSVAGTGQAGLASAEAYRPDVVLLDVVLPDLDGFEVCRRLRASPAQAEIPIVLVTALDDRASRLTGLQAGADDFLGKPLDWAELRARVHHLTRFNRYRILLHERAQFDAALRVKTQQLQDLSRRLLEVQEAERRFLAAELHDDVGQVLTGLRLILELAARPDQPAPARQASLAQAQTLLQELTARVRALSLDLRPAMLDDFGLFAALEWLFERFTRQTHIAVRHNLNYRDERRFPRPVETAAFRIVQEALTNVARHAGVAEAEVSLHAAAETLGVVIRDQGRGFDLAQLEAGVHHTGGLSGMRERAAWLAGALTLETQPGRGTQVTARFPLAGAGGSDDADHADPG